MARKVSHVDILITHFQNIILPSFENVRVVSYVLVSVLLVGGAGIWMPWAKETHVGTWLPGATVFTYSFALLGSIICNRLYFYTKSLREIKGLVDREDDNVALQKHFENHEVGSILSAWGMIFGSFIIILITVAYSKYYNTDSVYGWAGFILSVLLYFFASAEDLDKKSSVTAKTKDNQDARPLMPSGDVSEESGLNSDFFSDGE